MSMDYREKCLSQKINACSVCGTNDSKLVVHHIDGDPNNHDLDNLTPMCKSCHSKLHTTKNPNGVLKRYQDKLPESTLSFGEGSSNHPSNGKATARIPLKPSTKELIDERKPDGVTYDYWIRQLMGVVE